MRRRERRVTGLPSASYSYWACSMRIGVPPETAANMPVSIMRPNGTTTILSICVPACTLSQNLAAYTLSSRPRWRETKRSRACSGVPASRV